MSETTSFSTYEELNAMVGDTISGELATLMFGKDGNTCYVSRQGQFKGGFIVGGNPRAGELIIHNASDCYVIDIKIHRALLIEKNKNQYPNYFD